MSGPGVRKPVGRRLLSAVPLLVGAVLLVPGPTIAAAVPAGPGKWMVAPLPVVPDREGWAVVTGTDVGEGGVGSWGREPGASPVLLPPLEGGYYAGASEITDQGRVAGYTVRHDGTTVPAIWTRQ
ncbi:MAG: hypothetical protein QG608_3417 [Actinomycetota bacterium]|nr:hypothetical protein [Actinomycetota bacterium]